MLEKNLEECLNNAFKFAHENNHEFVTTEHLLLCILNNQDALNVLLACDVNIDILEAELKEFISKNCPEKKRRSSRNSTDSIFSKSNSKSGLSCAIFRNR